MVPLLNMTHLGIEGRDVIAAIEQTKIRGHITSSLPAIHPLKKVFHYGSLFRGVARTLGIAFTSVMTTINRIS